jgi:Alpha/beta hydrolase domain containing 18
MQRGSKLLCVSDLLLLGKATIDESRSLLHWLEAEAGFPKTGICGLSMGKKPYLFTLVKFLISYNCDRI